MDLHFKLIKETSYGARLGEFKTKWGHHKTPMFSYCKFSVKFSEHTFEDTKKANPLDWLKIQSLLKFIISP